MKKYTWEASEMNFYSFIQNKLCDTELLENDKLCYRIVVEAKNKDRAIKKAKHLGVDLSLGEDMSCDACLETYVWNPPNKLTFPYRSANFLPLDRAIAFTIKYKTTYHEKTLWRSPDQTEISPPRYDLFFNDIEQYIRYIIENEGTTYSDKIDTRIYYADGKVVDIRPTPPTPKPKPENARRTPLRGTIIDGYGVNIETVPPLATPNPPPTTPDPTSTPTPPSRDEEGSIAPNNSWDLF